MSKRSLPRLNTAELGEDSQDLILHIATVLLGASMVDAVPRNREIRLIRHTLNRGLRVEASQTRNVMRKALRKIIQGQGYAQIGAALDKLRETLNLKQRVSLYSALFSIVMADGHVDTAEKYYLELVAEKLELANEKLYTSHVR